MKRSDNSWEYKLLKCITTTHWIVRTKQTWYNDLSYFNPVELANILYVWIIETKSKIAFSRCAWSLVQLQVKPFILLSYSVIFQKKNTFSAQPYLSGGWIFGTYRYLSEKMLILSKMAGEKMIVFYANFVSVWTVSKVSYFLL